MILALILIFVFNLQYAEWIELDHNAQLFEHSSVGLDHTEIQFRLDGYETETLDQDGVQYTKISYFREGEFSEAGKPDLPRFTRLYAIPDQGEVSFRINSFRQDLLENVLIYPIQENQSESQPARNEFQIDRDFYNGNTAFPAALVEIGDPVIMRDIRLVQVTIHPFRYDPAARELIVFSEIDLSITTDEQLPAVNSKTTERKLSRSFEPIYQATIQNYDEVRTERTEYQIPCILFIYPNNNDVLNTLTYLTDWKKQMGYDVRMASTAVTGTTTTSIKNYIQNAYNTWQNPPEFVTFVGDASGSFNIPTFYVSNGEGDHPYSQLEGNDILADVILGRLSFNTISEFQTIVSKVLNYEKTPYMGNTNWFNRSLMVGDPSTSGPSCVFTKQSIVQMMNYHLPNIVATEVYSGSYSGQMSSNLSSGVAYFNYRGYYGMSGFTDSNINALTNGNMLSFAVFLTCGTGSFAGGTSRSETFIRTGTPTNQKGAIAAIGTATLSTHTSMNNAVDLGIFYGLFAHEIYNPGGALLMGKLHLYNSFPGDPSGNVTRFSTWNTLMGDPSVKLWTGTPQNLSVLYDNDLNIGANFIEIEVLNQSGIPVENAWICALSNDGNTAESGYTDANGQLLLNNQFDSASSVTLTVTGQNLYPHQGQINVVSSPVFINISDYVIVDDNNGTSAGNGDGLINPGESIELQVGMHNYGTATANSVIASISSPNDNINITDPDEAFGNIDGGSTQYSIDDFDFTVATNTLGGTDIQLDFVIEDAGGNLWTDHLFLPVHSANLFASDYTIDDANGIFEPGETVEMIVTLFNTGSVAATDLEAQLLCDHENIALLDSLAVFPTILPGSSANNNSNRFEISAEPSAINGSQISFSLLLTNAAGFEQLINLIVDLGIVTVNDPLGPDSYGYYAYDSGDVSYDLAPVYNWIEIDPSYGGSGAILSLYDNGDNGAIVDVPMPFNFNFYGYNYDLITVCSNGWIAPGGAAQASYMNTEIPGPHGPNPMIAVFWDDLKTNSGNVCYYHDTSLQVFIVEWSRVQTDWNNSSETFQVLIFDPSYYPTPSGDADIVFQYHTVNNTSTGSYSGSYNHGQYATVGIEDQSSLIGLGYTYNNTYPTAAMTLQNQMAIKFTTVGGGALSPPVLMLNQTSFDFLVQPGASTSQILEITNQGEANLIYNFSKTYLNLFEGSRNQGGPDNYGYVWYDSNEPGGPVYNWRDITGIGTGVTFAHNDEGTSLMPIGFDFNFYGTTYSQFRINPNGWIGFGADNTAWQNSTLPDADAPRPAIMPFWDDLDPLDGGDVLYYSTADSLVVWFDDVIHYVGNYNGTYDFQMIIYASGEMLFQYREVSGDIDSATIGIQNSDASDALLIAYNTSYVQNELAVGIKKIIDWADVSPSAGFVQQNETASVIITANAEELYSGQYQCDLILATNDPDAQNTVIPLQMIVLTDFPQIELSQDIFNFGKVLIGEEAADTLVVTNVGNQLLTVSEIVSSLPEFQVDINSFNLPAGASQEVQITFAPAENILYEAALTVFSNDPIQGEKTVELFGDATYPVIELSQSFFDFGTVTINSEKVDTLLVSNIGTDILQVSSLAVSGTVFSLDTTGFSLQPGFSEEIYLTFLPTDEIVYEDTLYIYSNDPIQPILTVELHGEGEIDVSSAELLPVITEVRQNYPNPFNPETQIKYSVSKADHVNIAIYNIRGERLRILIDSFHEPQNYSVVWNGRDQHNKPVASGVYFYRFLTGDVQQIKKMLLIK